MAERVIPQGTRERLEIGAGLTLVQIPYSPFCISVRAMMEAGGVPHRLHNLALWDRRAAIELTDGAYYAVPVLVDAGRSPAVVVYESRDEAQDIARYLDTRFELGLFPDDLDGLHDLVVQYIESQIEDVAFRLDDIYMIPGEPDVVSRTLTLRHKERKFGKGCLDVWRSQADALRATLVERLSPLDRMLARRPFLLGERPTFADFAFFGVLGNLTYTGDNEVPREVPNVLRWHAALPAVRLGARPPVAP